MLTLARRSAEQGPAAPAIRSEVETGPSVLGPGVTIQGTLEIEGELVIAGLVKGRIMALKLTIAAGGYIEGDVIARDVVIAGRLNGRVFAPNVSVEASAEVEGRLFHTNITVARGAHVDGRMPWRPVNYFENLDTLPEIRS